MKQTSGPTKKAPAEAVLKDIRRATRRQFTVSEGPWQLRKSCTRDYLAAVIKITEVA